MLTNYSYIYFNYYDIEYLMLNIFSIDFIKLYIHSGINNAKNKPYFLRNR